MNGVHDMGGMDGFGKVEPEPNEPMFHTEWEGRVLAMVRAMGAAGAFNIDTSRYYREALPPEVYMTSSYYRKWFIGLEDMLVAKGYITAEEVAAAHARRAGKTAQARQVHGRSGRAHHGARQVRPHAAPRPPNSSRAIGCVRKTSIPRRIRGCRVMCAAMSARSSSISVAASIPNSAANEAGENPQWLYTVVFDSAELWGPDADPTVKISVDAFEPYLEPA